MLTIEGADLAALAGAGQPLFLPPLREDLFLHPGPTERDGSPTWTIRDPVRNRYFRIGRLAFEMLSRWDTQLGDLLLQRVARETTLSPDRDDLDELLRFLYGNNLLRGDLPGSVDEYRKQVAASKVHWLTWLLHNYLFFRIPLVRPDKFLDRTRSWVEPLYSRWFRILLGSLFVVGLYLVARQWDTFVGTFSYFFSFEGIAWYGITLALVKVAHELGHAYTAKRFGCRIPTMGLAFLVMWPVLYTDTTDAWRLPSRRQRLTIGAAGMATELGLAVIATFLWSFLPDGPARSAAFFVATTTWILTLAINLNPFMRFDGYYLLSDFLGVQNMQGRAFALARWKVRRLLLGLDDPPPEQFKPSLQRALLAYAWGTWIYRFFLFLGIALVVYHLFFKLLGLVLFAVEISWFILRPLWSELLVWWRLKHRLGVNLRLLLTVSLLLFGVGLLVMPWNSRVELPALWRSDTYAVLFPPVAARIAEVHVQEPRAVKKGEILFVFNAPKLDHDISQSRSRIDILRLRIDRQAADPDDLERLRVLQQELATQESTLSGLLEQRQALTIRAPFDGQVTDLERALLPGRWVNENTSLALVVAKDRQEVRAYVSETDLRLIRTGEYGRFYPDDLSRAAFAVKVGEVEQVNRRSLETPYQASIYKGLVAVREDGKGALIPEKSIYRVTLIPQSSTHGPNQVVRGVVLVDSEAHSILSRLWQRAASVFIRESGF